MKTARDLNQITTYHRDLILELKRYSIPADVRPEDKVTLTQEQKAHRIKLLSKEIAKTNEKIAELENKEITLDEMNKDSYYTRITKLKNSVVRMWKRRETLNNHSTSITGQHAFKKFTYKRSTNSNVNKIVEKYFSLCTQKLRDRENASIFGHRNKKPSSVSEKFDGLSVIGLRNYLNKEIEKSKISYSVTEVELVQIFDDLIKEQNKRRWSDFNDGLLTISQLNDLQPDTVPNENDEEFQKQIEENAEKATTSMASVIAKFIKIDKEQNKEIPEPKFLGQDDVGENEMDIDDEEDDEDENEDNDEVEGDADDEEEGSSNDNAVDAEESVENGNGVPSTSKD